MSPVSLLGSSLMVSTDIDITSDKAQYTKTNTSLTTRTGYLVKHTHFYLTTYADEQQLTPHWVSPLEGFV